MAAPTRSDIRRETDRRLRRLKLRLGQDLERIRIDAGVSVRALERATGIDHSHIRRIEAGLANPSLEALIALGNALGADLGARYFAGTGPRIHDRFQAPMVECLLRALNPRWRPELEVVINAPALGVIDAVLHERQQVLHIATEFQSELRRLEQQIRWGHEKAEGLRVREAGASPATPAPAISELLVLRSTVNTRELARRYEDTLRTAFPGRAADAYAALTSADVPWPGRTIVWMQVHGSRVWLMRRPPTGVNVGR